MSLVPTHPPTLARCAGRGIAFPKKAPRRTGRLRRALASAFACFVPEPLDRSPAPSMRTMSRRPGSRVSKSWVVCINMALLGRPDSVVSQSRGWALNQAC